LFISWLDFLLAVVTISVLLRILPLYTLRLCLILLHFAFFSATSSMITASRIRYVHDFLDLLQHAFVHGNAGCSKAQETSPTSVGASVDVEIVVNDANDAVHDV
jgi:hypothetical protein